jgi:hypothetical protein
MRKAIVLLIGLVLSSGWVNAQVGRELKKAKAKNNIIEISEKKECGEKFVLVTTDEKGAALESWFFDGICVYARWLSRGGGEPEQEYKELIWGINFPNEKVVKKDERSWQGESGNSISWSKTKDGMDVMSVTAKKMDDITRKEVVRQYEKMKKEGVTQKSIPEKTREGHAQASDDEAEMNDFIGGVYRGGGNVHRAGNVIMTEDGLIFKSGSRFIYQNGESCQHVGSTYIRDDNSVVVRAGNAFISNDGLTEKVGSNYIGPVNSFPSGSTTVRQGWSSR